MSLTVDLNADLGEGAGFDSEILDVVSSANIACGFHASDPASILRSLRVAGEKNVSIGAHPSLLDRENFGRKEIAIEPAEVFAQVLYQLGAFNTLATAASLRVNHIKPHGALYNMAARDEGLAEAIVRAMLVVDPYLILFAPPNSALERVANAAEIRVVREAFADRNYRSDGSLVPRTETGALLTDPEDAARRVIRMLREGKVTALDGAEVSIQAETICVHGDTPGAVEFVRNLKVELELQGVHISAPESSV